MTSKIRMKGKKSKKKKKVTNRGYYSRARVKWKKMSSKVSHFSRFFGEKQKGKLPIGRFLFCRRPLCDLIRSAKGARSE